MDANDKLIPCCHTAQNPDDTDKPVSFGTIIDIPFYFLESSIISIQSCLLITVLSPIVLYIQSNLIYYHDLPKCQYCQIASLAIVNNLLHAGPLLSEN